MSVGIQISFHVWGVFRDAVKRERTIAIVYSTLKHLTLKPYRFNSAVIVVRWQQNIKLITKIAHKRNNLASKNMGNRGSREK